MNLILISYKTNGGGAGRIFSSVQGELSQHGHNVVPFIGLYDQESMPEEWLEFQPPPVKERNPFAIARRAFPDGSVNRQLNRLIDKVKPDVAVVQNLLQYVSPDVINVLHSRGIPVVFFVNDYGLGCVNGYCFKDGHPCHKCTDRRFLRGLFHGCSLHSGVMSTLQAAVRSVALQYHWRSGVYDHVGAVYTNGRHLTQHIQDLGVAGDRISKGVFPYVPDVGQGGEPDLDDPYFVFYGAQVPPKGQHIILAALEHFDEPVYLKFFLLRASKALEGQIAAINAAGKHRVELDVTSKWETGVREQVQRSIAVIIPNCWNSPHDLVLTESMSLGKAVIAASETGNEDIITDGQDGIIFEMANPQSLAEKMSMVMKDLALVDRLGKASRETFERLFTPPMWYKPLMEAVELAIQHEKNKT